ncbi:hypothetical protein C5E45_32770 [Nocardia nova]|uniref:Uncharacterized protein n=1 Tax=Nocardia nova TaxID=37330 RepID=A0A2S6ACS0_9NOCA|nr:hypothetical protein C5E45_32770 [Nocardia nova]
MPADPHAIATVDRPRVRERVAGVGERAIHRGEVAVRNGLAPRRARRTRHHGRRRTRRQGRRRGRGRGGRCRGHRGGCGGSSRGSGAGPGARSGGRVLRFIVVGIGDRTDDAEQQYHDSKPEEAEEQDPLAPRAAGGGRVFGCHARG